VELSAVNENAAEHEDGFVGNERSDDSEHQQAEDGEVSVSGEEMIDAAHPA
jgi:hypothetical protein